MLKHRLCTGSGVHISITGRRGYGSGGLLALGRELESKSGSPLSCFSLPPLLQLPTPTETILMMTKSSLRKRESNYPSVSSACWWLGGKQERAQGKRMGRDEPDHPFGRSRRVSTAIFAYYIFITNHLPATLAALIPKHHQCVFPRHPSGTCGWDYPLPTNRPTHPLTPTTVFTWKYLLQVPHSVRNRSIIVAKWKFPA